MKPHLKQTRCIGRINGEFIARMEELLWLYSQPYEPQYPVIYIDERPCFLIGELVEPLGMQSGQVRKEHYAFKKEGSCRLLAAIEPLTGPTSGARGATTHHARVFVVSQRLATSDPEAIKIRLVQDNLSTHTMSVFSLVT